MHRRQDVLQVEKRRRLYECVLANPGIHFQGVRRAANLPTGTARYHLTILARAGLVVERRYGHTQRFLATKDDRPDWQRTVLLREPELRVLHDWLASNPGAVQRVVLDAMSQRGWSRSTTQHRLKRLADAGLVQILLMGRYKRYTLDSPLGAAIGHASRLEASGTPLGLNAGVNHLRAASDASAARNAPAAVPA